MATIGNLVVGITSNTAGLSRGLKSASSQVKGFASGFGGLLAGGLALGGGLLGLSTAFDAVRTGIKGAADMEQAQVAFSTLLGNADAAKMVLQDLSKFAADTPFEIPELTDAGRSLAAFGFGARDIVPNLRMLGDVASGIGQPIGEIAEIYGKARVQGRLFGEDINQLTGRGIPVIGELARQFGVSESKVKELVSEGKVGFPELEQAFQSMTGAGGKFSGMMEAQSRTLAGVWSTFSDTVGTALRDVATELLATFDFKALIQRTADGIKSVGDTIVFGIRNAGSLLEIGLLEWELIAAQTVPNITGPLVAMWDASTAAFGAFATNIKGGLTEIGNLASALAGAIRDAFNAALAGENPLQAFTDSFTKTLAEQENAISAGNPLTVFRDTFNQTLQDVRDGIPAVTDGIIAEQNKLWDAIASNEQKRQLELERSAAAGAAAADAAGNGTPDMADTKPKKDLTGAGAFQAGSSEAFGSILAAMRGESKDPTVEVAKTTKDQLAESKRQTALLRKQEARPTIELVAGRV